MKLWVPRAGCWWVVHDEALGWKIMDAGRDVMHKGFFFFSLFFPSKKSHRFSSLDPL